MMANLEQGKIKAFSIPYILDKIVKVGAVLAVLYFISLKDYLLFHSLVELAVAALAVAIFLLAWNSRKFSDSGFYVFIGSVFLASGLIMILHALAYKGMGVIATAAQDANPATQLWLANQYILAAGFVAAPFFARRKLKFPAVVSVFLAITALFLLSIFWWKNFPAAYVEGSGLTAFKTQSEYFVAFLFLLSAYFFFRKKNEFDPKVVKLFYLIAVLFSVSTIIFTLYIGVFSSMNMWGHLIRLAAMYPVYIGVVEFGLMKPYKFLFGNLKRREEDLKKNEKMFRAVVEDQGELICRFLPDGTLTFVNDAYCRYYGMARDTLLGKKYFEHTPNDVADDDKKHLRKLTPESPVVQVEHRAIDKSGWHRWQHWTTRAIFDAKNSLIEYQSVGRDITQQRYIQEALTKSEEKYRSLVDNSLVGVYRADLDGNYLYINEAMAKMFEFESPEEMIRESAKIRYENAQDREHFIETLKKQGRVTNYELVGITKSGKRVHVLSSATLHENDISGMILDITERKQAEQDLLEAKKEWEKTFDSVPDLIAILDPKHKILRANKAMAERLGTIPEKCVGLNCYQCVHNADKPIANCPHSLTLADGKEHIAEVDEPGLGGTFLVSTTPFFGNDGKLAGSVHVARDITERKKAEKKIANLAKFPEENPNPVLRIGRRGMLIYANKASRKLLKHWKLRVGEIVPEKLSGLIKELLGSGEKKEILEEFEGKIYSILFAPISKGGYVNLYGLDVTEIKKVERAKDEFISLASHQLRTPLSSIALSSELLLRGVAGEVDSGQKDYVQEIFKATKRMTLLVSNLLNVSRVEMGNFQTNSEPLDAVPAIREIAKGLAPLAAEKNLKIEENFEQDTGSIKFDANSFGIMFENILSNAIRYTPRGGSISIGVSREKNGILLKVSDTGCGIPEKQKQKIFNKSFRAENAKEISSEGAGLGLYMARVAAERGRAKIWFESEEGKGTTFFVLFSK
jgi:PAS domain S-box-containing protein